MAVILALGTIGVLIAGLQPQLLGALAMEGRVTVDALGTLAATGRRWASRQGRWGSSCRSPGCARSRSRRCWWRSSPTASARLDVAVLRCTDCGRAGLRARLSVSPSASSSAPPGRSRWSGAYLMVQTLAQFAIAEPDGPGSPPTARRASPSSPRSRRRGRSWCRCCRPDTRRWLRRTAAGAAPPARGVVALLALVLPRLRRVLVGLCRAARGGARSTPRADPCDRTTVARDAGARCGGWPH
ncbi:hypothetical protein AB5I41_08245 [Sphingomonas sp. MMS24-JH45]